MNNKCSYILFGCKITHLFLKCSVRNVLVNGSFVFFNTYNVSVTLKYRSRYIIKNVKIQIKSLAI